jgi:hypothetical protein
MRSALLAVAETKLHSLERHPLAPGQLRLLASVMLSRAADLEVCVCERERGVCVCMRCVWVFVCMRCVGVCVHAHGRVRVVRVKELYSS